MKYYLIAGEPSGDLQASYLIKELAITDNNAQFRCFGGDLMEKQGAVIAKHYSELAFMGVEQVLLNLRTIFRNIAYCKEDILNFKPDVLILVDYPGFNMKIAKWSKANNIKTYYYISPKIWAWNQKRVHKIKKLIDRMFVILPFEKEFYAKFNYDVDFVGHPLLDCIADRHQLSISELREKYQLNDKPIIAILPGSRKQEISLMLKIMLSVVKKFPDYQFVIAGAPSQPIDFYQQFITEDVAFIDNKTYDLLQHSHAAIVASGTANLETALYKIPQVVCFKTGWLFFNLAKIVIKVEFISLVNLIMKRKVVTELVQSKLTTVNLTNELTNILTSPGRENLLKEYEKLHLKLGGKGASKKAAELIVSALSN